MGAMMKYAEKWDLNGIFSGGSSSKSLQVEMDRIKSEILRLESLKSCEKFLELVKKMQEVDASLRECDAFIRCLQSENSEDEKANQLRAEFSALQAHFLLFENSFDDFLVKMDEASFQSLMSHCQSVCFVLEERRVRARMKLSCEKEDLVTALSVDGYHSWGELYPMLVDEIRIPFQSQTLSFGQAENKLADPDRKVRESVFTQLEVAWKGKAPLFSQVLNHIAGFRLQVYKQRGWNDPLGEPLFENRMSKETLDAMWGAVVDFKKPLLHFMQVKADVLGTDKLAWFDMEASLFDGKVEVFPYDVGAQIVIDSLEKFHPKMGEFARKSCSERWVEAEDRVGKRPGGYCILFPKSKQSRIFMTYSGTMVNISTLAHEIGHAYHNAMVADLPSFSQNYRMNIAETASTFAEHILSDALLEQAKTREEKLKILSDRIQRSVVFMMNIHARFLFETGFYEERKNKFLSPDELCGLMQNAQEVAYDKSLSVWHPYFWAAKLHFYFTEVAFYNFPYTFGYLLSLGIYNRAKSEREKFVYQYDAMLRESAIMSVEDLVQKHFGFDLTKPEFWREACAAAVADVDVFLKLLKSD